MMSLVMTSDVSAAYCKSLSGNDFDWLHNQTWHCEVFYMHTELLVTKPYIISKEENTCDLFLQC